MTTYNRPGVYINELPLAAAPINGALAATAAGAVIGAFPQGPDTVTLVTSWYDFTKKYGGYSSAYPSTFSVGSFFANGGTQLYVKRILPLSAQKVAKVAVPSAPVSATFAASKYSVTAGSATLTTAATGITLDPQVISLAGFVNTAMNGTFSTSSHTTNTVTFASTSGSTAATTSASVITAVTPSTPAVGSVRYAAVNTFTAGQWVTVTGIGVATGFNTSAPVQITTATSAYFEIPNGTTVTTGITYTTAVANTYGASVTAVAASTPASGSVTYSAVNTFVAGQTVDVLGASVSGYNVVNAVITSATATSFVVANSTTGAATFTGGTAIVNSAPVTAASYASNLVTYTAANSFIVGQIVTITGLTTAAFNQTAAVTALVGTAGAYTGFVTAGTTGTAIASGAAGQATTNENVVAAGTLTTSLPANLTYATFAAKHRGLDGNNIRVQITQSKAVRDANYFDVTVLYDTFPSDTVVNSIVTANYTGDTIVEQFNGVVFNDSTSGDYIVGVLEFGSAYVRVLTGGVVEYNADGTVLTPQVIYTVGGTGQTPALNNIYALSGAPTPQASLTYADYTGNVYNGTASPATGYDPANSLGTFVVSDCTVFTEFEFIDQPLVLFMPDVVTMIAATSSPTAVPAGWTLARNVYNALIAWVEKPATSLRHFVVVETAPNLTVDVALANIQGLTNTSRAAAYYPHVYTKDPVGRSQASVRRMGPSGAVAGIYLNTDRNVGPFKAPAGIDASIVDAIALERAFSPAELDALNTGITTTGLGGSLKVAVNAIRNLPGAGVVVMGARTLLQDNTANRYVNMRRSLTYLEKRLNDLVAFAVFQNNTEKLWASIITVVGVFLNEYRNQGGLRGSTIAQSYYVKCDADNNTPASIAAGEVHVEVGVALEYPAEFVVINLSQKSI